MVDIPNPLIDPVKPSNTRELREQVARARRLEESMMGMAQGAGYTVVNTQMTGPDAIPEPIVKNISISPGQKLALPFDEVTPLQVNAQSWTSTGQQEQQSSNGPLGECNIQSEADTFYGLK